MKNYLFTLLAPVALLGSMCFSASAMAQDNRTPYINWREENQQARISQGIRTGELTGWEAAQLERKEAIIQHQKFVAKEDGYLTNCERAKLNRELNHVSKKIYREKHNRYEQPWAK